MTKISNNYLLIFKKKKKKEKFTLKTNKKCSKFINYQYCLCFSLMFT